MSMKTILISLLIFLPGFLVQAQPSAFKVPDSTTKLKTGDLSPDFSFALSPEKRVDIRDYRGKIVMIDFFATWCGPCMHEMPRIEKEIWEKYQHNPHFVLLAFAREQGWGVIDSFKMTHPFSFPLLPDTGRQVYGLFATEYIPRNIILDENGNILFQSTGYLPDEFDRMKAVIDNKLGNK